MDNDARTITRLRPFRTPVRGHAFSAVPPGERTPRSGLSARLAREPDNPADPLAVAVWAGHDRERPWRVGYLDRAVAARVAPRLDAGARIAGRLDGWVEEPEGRWRRPVLLVLPERGPTPDQAPAETAPVETTPAAANPVATAPVTDPVERERTATQVDPAVGEPGVWGRPPGVRRRRISSRAR